MTMNLGVTVSGSVLIRPCVLTALFFRANSVTGGPTPATETRHEVETGQITGLARITLTGLCFSRREASTPLKVGGNLPVCEASQLKLPHEHKARAGLFEAQNIAELGQRLTIDPREF